MSYGVQILTVPDYITLHLDKIFKNIYSFEEKASADFSYVSLFSTLLFD